MNAYEIRHAIFQQASDTLHMQWHAAREAEREAAMFEKRAPKISPPPTLEEIKKYASDVVDFVSTKAGKEG